METKMKLFTVVLMTVFLTSVAYIIQKSNRGEKSDDHISFVSEITDEIVITDVNKNINGTVQERFKKYEIIEYQRNDLSNIFILVAESYYEGKDDHRAYIEIYERNSIGESFTLSKDGSISSVNKPYQDLLDFVKNNNVFDYTDKQLSDMFGSASLESGYYLGQDIRNVTKGLPAVVWRAWSPNYKNLVYVYKNEITLDRKNPPEFGTRVFIENGDDDLVFNNTVPFSYFPEFPNGFYDFNPIIFINDQEFYFIAQNNWGAENKGKFASDKIKLLTEKGEEILAGVYAFNAETLEYRLIDKLPATGRKYKYITYENKMYVYGGDLENVRVYNNNGELEKTLEYNGRERDLAVITFVNWGTRVEDGIKKDIAMFENNDVTNYVEGISIVLE